MSRILEGNIKRQHALVDAACSSGRPPLCSPGANMESRTLSSARADTLQILQFLDRGNDWDRHLTLGRSVISRLDATSCFQRPDQIKDQVWFVDSLQRLAYFDPDSGGTPDIAQWCLNKWLQMFQEHGDNAAILQGLGHAWLFRVQQSLAQIHRNEGSSSSGSSGGTINAGHQHYTAIDEARDTAQAIREADFRLHGAEYVEARGDLLPSTEYFARAVSIAEREHTVTGSLLALAAEAFMSLGNVSYSSINERYFQQALVYLRRASQIPGFALSPYLQQYLDDYGRLLEE